MKKCSEIKELISLYIDDELEMDQRMEFEKHIDSCEECRNELDEFTQIVGLCRTVTEEELPINFRIELHQKLLEVQKQSEAAAKKMFYNTKYFKLFSSVAAVFLLVFLLRGFYNFDLFSNEKLNQSAESNMMAAAPEEGQLRMKVLVPETGNGSGNSIEKSGDSAQDYYYGDKGTQVGSAEIDRSTKEDREFMAGLTPDATNESVTRNTTSITILVDDPDTQVENIKAVAVESSGVEQPIIQPDGSEVSYTVVSDESSDVLLLSIPSMQLNAFIDALNTGYGQSNVQPEAVITEDMSVAIEDLLKQSDNLDLEIEKVENADDSNADDLDKLKEQKTELQNKIDTIRMESDLTNVKVILKKK